MARRHLEKAIQDSYELELEGKLLTNKLPDTYSKIDVYKAIHSEEDIDGVYSLQYSPDGSKIAVGSGNEAMRLYDTASGRHLTDLRKPRYGGYPVTALKWHPYDTHILFAATCQGNVYSLNTNTNEVTKVVEERKNEINCLDFSEDGTCFATSGKDLAVRIYDTKSCKIVTEYEGFKYDRPQGETEVQGHGMRVFALKYSPENRNIIVTGGWDNHLKIWDTRSTDGVKRTIAGPHICGDSLDLKGFQILTGSWVSHNSLQIWDYSSGKLIKNVPFPDSGEGEYLYVAQFCENDTVIAGGSGTNSMKSINTNTGEVLGEISLDNKCIQALDSTRGGQLVAVGGQSNIFKTAVIS